MGRMGRCGVGERQEFDLSRLCNTVGSPHVSPTNTQEQQLDAHVYRELEFMLKGCFAWGC